MTHKNNNIIKKIKDAIKDISTKLESYEKVDATLSNETLVQTLFFLRLSNETLESGFVKDACNEIDNFLSVN